ncbi:methylcrotonoyl-CoA carboxylase [Streptomyces albus]|uniref:Methylcrotonoyl-CoA carboxylase n=2 Tax=Streptomyces TaxID=1883 RepID=A0A0B5FA49_STRA4|nr:methylcrotonoyl-CoA carboxylase [Streptomyces albus]AOU81635.1 methylcrotonoyl-CoA carboxylase [Streptomyces albus]
MTMPIRKLLVANRGEIATRVIRTAHALGISTVAVYADPDADAPYVALADEAVRLPGAAPGDTYLRGDLVIGAALATGADAVHPGYGFLSENAEFAAHVAAAGLVHVGPSPEAIASMGSKLHAKRLMAAAGVPVLPGGEVTEDGDVEALAARVGFPMLVKASYGGGGRGMRLVHEYEELADAVDASRREAAAFGNGTVFVERYVPDPRHIEVQIIGDARGTVVHLFERECSIQRRYQKIVEEAPSPAVDDELRAELGAAAVAAGEAIGYVGAGTVEFVLDATGRFSFLEMNTRLQVEHPVTELVTGVDLVETQLRIAAGEPIPPEVLSARLDGHAIEARLYAEDVAAGYRPATGTLHRFDIPEGPQVRVDTGVWDGSVITPHYDAMLAKVIGFGHSRTDAAFRLARALSQARLHGVTTNRDLLVSILREPEFLAGGTDTGYLSRHDPVVLAATAPRTTVLHALAAALARQAGHREAASALSTLPSGWRNVRSAFHRVDLLVGDRTVQVAYRIGDDSVEATVDGSPVGEHVRLLAVTSDAVDIEVDRVRGRWTVHRVELHGRTEVYVDGADGATAFLEVPRFPDPTASEPVGSMLASMPGTVVRMLAARGEAVTAGQPLMVLEAMKMEHTVTAPADGTVLEIRVGEGDRVDTGQVLVVLDGEGDDG